MNTRNYPIAYYGVEQIKLMKEYGGRGIRLRFVHGRMIHNVNDHNKNIFVNGGHNTVFLIQNIGLNFDSVKETITALSEIRSDCDRLIEKLLRTQKRKETKE